jgi:hypothetical protein
MPSSIFLQNEEQNNDNEFAPSGTMCFFEVVQSSSKSSSQHSLASKKKKKKKAVKSQGGIVNELVSFGGTCFVDTQTFYYEKASDGTLKQIKNQQSTTSNKEGDIVSNKS